MNGPSFIGNSEVQIDTLTPLRTNWIRNELKTIITEKSRVICDLRSDNNQQTRPELMPFIWVYLPGKSSIGDISVTKQKRCNDDDRILFCFSKSFLHHHVATVAGGSSLLFYCAKRIGWLSSKTATVTDGIIGFTREIAPLELLETIRPESPIRAIPHSRSFTSEIDLLISFFVQSTEQLELHSVHLFIRSSRTKAVM